MATWKRLTGAIDSSAQSFLKNKRFSREKKKFTWDWHAWNLALVSSPSLLLAYYLHGVEKRMEEDALVREEIQERTGVSSRGFLIPKKDVREEVLGMLGAGNQRGLVRGDGDAGGGGAELPRQAGDEEEGLGGKMPNGIVSIERRLANIESMLGVQGGSSSTAGIGTDVGAGGSTDSRLSSTVGSSPGEKVSSARHTASKAGNSGGDGSRWMATADKAMEAASAAGSWVVKNGERQGKRLFQLGRDWLADENRQESAIHSEESGLTEGEGEGEATEHHAAPEKNVETHRQEGLCAEKALDSVGSNSSSTGGGTAAVSTRRDSNEGA